MSRVIPVILCGGSGTRLWPLSKSGCPKQFISILGQQTLFQDAVARIKSLNNTSVQPSSLYVVIN